MASSNASTVTSNNLIYTSKQGNITFNTNKSSDQQSGKMDLEQLQHMINCTVKKNPKAELSKSDLLRLLGYLEGELQARDVVIATLKADRVKQLVSHARYGRLLPVNDPYVALQRDGRSATVGGSSADDAALLKAVTEGPMAALDALVTQHRKSHVKLIQAMQEAETRHSKVLRELDEEKQKHEHDTAQGDDITYGLEKERTRLREELEIEKQARKKLEKDMKKIQDTLEEERQRQKQIVLLLLAERKKLILKYVEERKKSEDLAQILSEEKGRVDSMAEGLEEESQKALQMEAELEKQLALFDGERAQLKAQHSREEKRTKELEMLVDKLQMEVDSLKKQQAEAHQVAMFQAGLNQPHSPPRMVVNRPVAPALNPPVGAASVPGGSSSVSPPQLPSKPVLVPPQTPPRASSVSSTGSSSPIGAQSPRASPGATSVPLASAPGHVVLGTTGKAIQPTATVSSTPVPAPTTGIARAVSPAGGIRNMQYNMTGPTAGVSPAMTATPGSSRTLPPPPSSSSSSSNSTPSSVTPVPTDPHVDAAAAVRAPTGTLPQQPGATVPRVAVSASPGTKVFTTTNKEGKVTFHVTTSATLPTAAPVASAAAVTGAPPAQAPAPGGGTGTQPSTPRKTTPVARGAPPPVPPNKPVIPPKKSSTVTAPTVAGQTINPSPVVVSSSSPHITTADHGQPISLEVNSLQKVGPQSVKFGITISKDKIEISSEPPNVPVHKEGPLSFINPASIVGEEVDHDPAFSLSSPSATSASQVGCADIASLVAPPWVVGCEHEITTAGSAACLMSPRPPPIPPPPSSSPLSPFVPRLPVLEWDVLDKELADFQQLLCSMTSNLSPSALSSTSPGSATLSSASTASSTPAAEESGSVMLHMGV